MRHMTWLIFAGMLLAPVAFAQDDDAPGPEDMEQHGRRLELREREGQMEFRQRQRELELQRMEVQLGAEREEHEADMAERAARTERFRHGGKGKCGGLVVLWMLVVHILLTIWVYKDMHEKKIARALWVPIVLLAGLGGALIYSVSRLGDTKEK